MSNTRDLVHGVTHNEKHAADESSSKAVSDKDALSPSTGGHMKSMLQEMDTQFFYPKTRLVAKLHRPWPGEGASTRANSSLV